MPIPVRNQSCEHWKFFRQLLKSFTMTDINPLAKEWEKHGLVLREYQKEGVEMMDSWYQAGHGGINGDEMGLGKTCQAIVQILRMKEDGKGPFLVVSPLSVCDHWSSEVERFSCGTLNPVGYHGYEAARAELLKQLGKLQKNTVFIVPFHIFRGDAELIAKFQEKSKLRFDVIIVDEAHNIKNSECQLAETLKPYRRKAWFLLMTGTPIQNHLGELYSLLTFVDPDQFKDAIKARSAFIERYKDNTNLPGLRKILSQYLIRRTKDLVCKELPSCEQVILYHNITEIQKRLYLDIIARDYEDLLMNTKQKHQSLNNIHMQLRKCVLHPYLFKGVEPEPFVEGEHMVEASGKFLVLDRLLRYLKEKKHKCLIFSQFVIVLDILQDFMNLRGYNYERFDGSVRAEERFAAINNFQQTTSKTKKGLREAEKDEPWCFLLTTRAGGVGLNLNAADTVIFMDADWNPQNDIQAMARCHRIGQNKPVRVIRLIARYTVEQHMHARIRDKLKFTDKVMGNEEVKITAFDMLGMIKQSLGTLKEQKHEKYELTDKDLESVIGETNADGEWLPMKNDKENQVPAALRLDPDDVDKRDTDYNDYRVYEGRHYRISAKDEAAFEELRLLRLAGTKRNGRRRSYVEGDGEGKDESVRADDVMKRMERAHEISEKRKIAAQAKKDALWTANGECPAMASHGQGTFMSFREYVLAKNSQSKPSTSTQQPTPGRVTTPNGGLKKLHSSPHAKRFREISSTSPENIPPKVPEVIDLTVCEEPNHCTSEIPRSRRIFLPRLNPPIIVLGEVKSRRQTNNQANRRSKYNGDVSLLRGSPRAGNSANAEPELIVLD
ncbi:hypothetical protein Y032_0009g825 [Ancylostoma ceylanicum]|uniref:Protein, SNF2 family n=1 Tax=Ancylostoma ceylanicum TaxID=53326 RepID=A0A016VKT8_9BILA|nr:hypothetical protein Y032_0009g825 [Ancylostoma ceylanicum]